MPTTQAIQAALQAVQNYINLLQTELIQASQAGNSSAVQTLSFAYRQAQNLETELTNLLTVNDVNAAAADVAAINQVTQQLTAQASQINTFVQGVGTAGTVLQAVAQLAATMAAL